MRCLFAMDGGLSIALYGFIGARGFRRSTVFHPAVSKSPGSGLRAVMAAWISASILRQSWTAVGDKGVAFIAGL